MAALCWYEEMHLKAPPAVCLQYFPQPLARLNHVEDSRMIGIRNYLSYLAVDDFTWAGLGECMHWDRRATNFGSSQAPLQCNMALTLAVLAAVIIFNKFRVEKLGLAPIRLGNKVTACCQA